MKASSKFAIALSIALALAAGCSEKTAEKPDAAAAPAAQDAESAAASDTPADDSGAAAASAAVATAAAATAAAATAAAGLVDGERIINADQTPGEWLSHGRTYDEQRYSPLKQISDKNVNELGLTWYADLPTRRGIETTPLMANGKLYVTGAWSRVYTYDAKTGEAIYEKKRMNGGRSFTSSPWAYDGKVFCLNEFGDTIVVQAGSEFKQLHTNELESDELTMATPAFADDRLILRTGDAVYCIGEN